jgi:hypothetical protein
MNYLGKSWHALTLRYQIKLLALLDLNVLQIFGMAYNLYSGVGSGFTSID